MCGFCNCGKSKKKCFMDYVLCEESVIDDILEIDLDLLLWTYNNTVWKNFIHSIQEENNVLFNMGYT